MKKVGKYLIIFTCGFIFAIALLLEKEDDSKMSDNEKSIEFKAPLLAKFGALIEREESYKAWISTMTDIKDSNEAKIEKIFNQIKDFPILSDLVKFKEDFPNKY